MHPELNLENKFLAIFIIVLAMINIIRKLRFNSLLTPSGGLHFNFLIFYGIGPLANTSLQLVWDSVVAKNIVIYTNSILIYIAACYFVYTVVALFVRNQLYAKRVVSADITVDQFNSLNIKILLLAFIGYLLSDQEFALSGIGTIFPVCKNLLFPCLVLLIYNVRKDNTISILLLLLGFILVGLNAFLSIWRSELIMFLFSIGVGLTLRNKNFFYYGLIFGPLLVALIIPFQSLKKAGKVKKDDNIAEVFVTSLNSAGSKSQSMAVWLLAYRLNYARESAYVLRGIDRGYIDYRYGDTYSEMILQLIPRTLWPEKPSYNYLANKVIPKKIGLMNKLDKYTSWGVNYFAEFLYNFPIEFLPLFFAFYFLLLKGMDRLAFKMSLSPDTLLLLQVTLFFQVLNTVTLSAASTYFLWSFLVVKLIDQFKPKIISIPARSVQVNVEL